VRDVEPEDDCRMPCVLAPEPGLGRLQGLADFEELERPRDTAPVVRVDGRRGAGILRSEQLMGALGPDPVVEVLRPLPNRRIDLGR